MSEQNQSVELAYQSFENQTEYPGSYEDTYLSVDRHQDQTPAGIINIRCESCDNHLFEILSLVGNVESRERMGRPMRRIISIQRNDHSIDIALTDLHITRAIVAALTDTYMGTLELVFTEKNSERRINRARYSFTINQKL